MTEKPQTEETTEKKPPKFDPKTLKYPPIPENPFLIFRTMAPVSKAKFSKWGNVYFFIIRSFF